MSMHPPGQIPFDSDSQDGGASDSYQGGMSPSLSVFQDLSMEADDGHTLKENCALTPQYSDLSSIEHGYNSSDDPAQCEAMEMWRTPGVVGRP